MLVRFEYSEKERVPQKMDHVRLNGDDVLRVLDSHQLFGFWRTELDTGHVYWSSDVFEIYGMEFTEGPVNLPEANAAVHPDDLPFMLELFERSAEEKTGFHYILRLRDGAGSYKYVRSVGRYRITPEGREEIYGIFEQFLDQIPLVGIMSPLPGTGQKA